MKASNQLQVRSELLGEIIEAGQYTPEIERAPIAELQELVHTIRVEHHHYNHEATPAPRMIPRKPEPRTMEMPVRMPVVTVEQTSKFWKGFQLAGACAMILGCIMFVVGLQSVDDGSNMSAGTLAGGLLLFPSGLIIYIISRIGAWWHHG